MIKIELKLFSTVARYMPDGDGVLPVEEGATIEGVGQRLGIPEPEMRLTFVNGRRCPIDYILQDGDRLGIFPRVGGG